MLLSWKTGKTENSSVKNSVNSASVTMIFSWKWGKTENTSMKISVNGTQGTMLFLQERGILKITPSKRGLTIHGVKCYFKEIEQD